MLFCGSVVLLVKVVKVFFRCWILLRYLCGLKWMKVCIRFLKIVWMLKIVFCFIYGLICY